MNDAVTIEYGIDCGAPGGCATNACLCCVDYAVDMVEDLEGGRFVPKTPYRPRLKILSFRELPRPRRWNKG